jgi:hypothetical protein
MSVYAEAYYRFIENEKIDNDLVDETIHSLEVDAKKELKKFEIHEYPSPATDPVNWILYIRSPKHSYRYVENYFLINRNDKESFPSLDLLIQSWYQNSKKNAKLAIEYIRFLSDKQNFDRIKSRGANPILEIPEAIPLIAKDSDCSLSYSLITKKRFVEGEKSIFEDPKNTITYLEKILNKKIPEEILDMVEKGISKNAHTSLDYALNYKEGIFPAGESSIALDGYCSLKYAKEIVKGRFELGEKSISESDDLLLSYAISVLGGKLPEYMHKKMSLKTFTSV